MRLGRAGRQALATGLAMVSGLAASQERGADGDRCAALIHAAVPGGQVVSAGIPASDATFASGIDAIPALSRLPFPGPLCRVALKLSPVPASDIRAEVWLPLGEHWNGKLLEAGNGGFGGSLSDPMLTMRHAATRGYAAAGNDMGHRAEDVLWLLRPDAVIDFEWRADRATSLAARALVKAFYGKPARLKYFEGCSTGGREAMMAARRFPSDYDGIVAGAPAAAYADLLAGGAWMQRLLLAPGARPDASDLKLVGDAGLAACDAADGLEDGLIGDPQACHIDIAKLVCTPGQTSGCLTPAKAAFFAQVYRGPRDQGGREILPGMPVGGEAIADGWSHWITRPDARHAFFARGAIGGMLLHDPQWTVADFDLARDLPRLRRGFADMGANTPDLEAFRRNGGRMIVYHGWADAGINPLLSVGWRDRVVARMGRVRTDQTMALFMIPGVSHCVGGPGPDSFAMLDALDAWRDGGVVPASVQGEWHEGLPFATLLGLPAGLVKAARPICRYPARARWDGKGDPAKAESFTCR